MLQQDIVIGNDVFDNLDNSYSWVVSSREYFADDTKFARLLIQVESKKLSPKECINLLGGIFQELLLREWPDHEESYKIEDLQECFNVLKLASLIANNKFEKTSNFRDAPTRPNQKGDWGGPTSFAEVYPRRLLGCMECFHELGARSEQVVAMLNLRDTSALKVEALKLS